MAEDGLLETVPASNQLRTSPRSTFGHQVIFVLEIVTAGATAATPPVIILVMLMRTLATVPLT